MTATPAALDGVLFDFGGVVVAGPFGAFADYEAGAGLPPGTLRRINATDPDTNAWARLERGEIGLDEFVDTFEREAAALGHRVDGSQVIGIVTAMSAERHTANPEMLAAVDRCRELGVSTVLVTNNVTPMAQSPGAAWVTDHFDAVIESCRAGVRKPDPAIYRLALERIGVAPERAAMLDDLGINLRPARALGMRTIKVTDPAAAAAELLTLLDAAA